MVVLHEHCDLKNVAREPQNNTKKYNGTTLKALSVTQLANAFTFKG